MDYGFEHEGRVFTPNGTADVSPADNEARNKAIEQAELARWQTQPEHMLAYYTFPAEQLPLFGRTRHIPRVVCTSVAHLCAERSSPYRYRVNVAGHSTGDYHISPCLSAQFRRPIRVYSSQGHEWRELLRPRIIRLGSLYQSPKGEGLGLWPHD